MVLIKICGITNEEDARAAVRAGADSLGFNFYRRSPRFIEPEAARRIIEGLPQGVLTVGVFVNAGAPETVAGMADEAGVGAIQLHGDETPEYCRRLKGRYVIKALRAREGFAPEDAARFETEAILLDAFSREARGGTGEVVDWRLASAVRKLVPRLFLAGGLSVLNVAEAIESVHPYAVDACSRLERAPGLKDAARLRAFVAAARCAQIKA